MAKRKTKQHIDWYQKITDQMIALLEKDIKPWSKPWTPDGYSGLPMRFNGEYYRGINTILLDVASIACGYKSGYWMTFRQAKTFGANVRKGETSTTIFKVGTFLKKTDSAEAEDTETQGGGIGRYLRSYNVFNADQIDGLPERFFDAPSNTTPQNTDTRRTDIDSFFGAVGADVRVGGDRAFYNPTQDFIQMPDYAKFKSASAYYAVLSHEHVHWTKPGFRVDRDVNGSGFGSQGYAREELVAELGAVFLSRFFQFENHDRDCHAAYLKGWLKILRSDKREFFKAAHLAQKSVDWMLEKANLVTPTQFDETLQGQALAA